MDHFTGRRPIGALCGVLIGVAVGAGTGAVAGLSRDVIRSELDDDFVAAIQQGLKRGCASIIMEADESATRLIDNVAAEHQEHIARQEVR